MVSVRMVPAIFYLSGPLRGRSLNPFSLNQIRRGAQFSNEDPFRLLLCGIPNETCSLIMLPLIGRTSASVFAGRASNRAQVLTPLFLQLRLSTSSRPLEGMPDLLSLVNVHGLAISG